MLSINISLKIFLFVTIFILTNQIEIYVLLMIFAVFHEIGHLVAGILLGLKPKKINIMPLGFCIQFNIPVEIYNKRLLKSNILSLKKLIIALAGPLVNLILSIIFIVVHMNTNLIYTNILICIFNLIPIYPLDGGRIIKNALKIIFGNKKAIKLTNVISNVLMIILSMVSSVAILYYKNIAIFFIVIYLWIVTIIENKNYNLKNKIYKDIENYNNICKQKFSEDVAKIHN